MDLAQWFEAAKALQAAYAAIPENDVDMYSDEARTNIAYDALGMLTTLLDHCEIASDPRTGATSIRRILR